MTKVTQASWLSWLLWLSPLAIALVLPGPGVFAGLVVVIVVLVRVREARDTVLRFWSGFGLSNAVLLGICGGLVVAILSGSLIDPMIDRAVGAQPDLSVLKGVQGHIIPFLELLAAGVLVGGVAEELICRGYVIGWGVRLFGMKASVPVAILSSVVFAASHLYQGVSGMLSTGDVGGFLAIIYLASGRRLLPVMLAHMTIDAYGIIELYRGAAFLPSLRI